MTGPGGTDPGQTLSIPCRLNGGARPASEAMKGKGRDRKGGIRDQGTDRITTVERQSTHSASPSQALVKRAISFIRYNATRGIAAADVAAHLGASRSLVDSAFRKGTGESVQGMILRMRIEAMKDKLRATDLPIARIATSCGFPTPTHAMTLFKARVGCTMREWRRSHSPGAT